MNVIAASLSPLQILDEMTDRLGAFLLELVTRVIALTEYVATLPAGMQVMVAVGGLIALGILAVFTLRALSRAGGILGNFHRASAQRKEARDSLPIADRHKAIGYVMAIGLILGAGVLLLFLVQSWLALGPEEVPKPVPGSGR